MKKTLTGFAILLVAALWMTGSWIFFNSIANGAENSPTASPPAAENQAKPMAPPAYDHHGMGHHGHGEFFKELNLTKAQKKQIKDIRAQERPKMEPLIKQLKTGRDELMTLRKTGKFDESKVRAIADEQGKALSNVIVERERVMYKIRAVLTPEQRAKFDKMREEWKTQHHKHWKKGPPKS
jgi:periplasmic protein CpxP/Spy